MKMITTADSTGNDKSFRLSKEVKQRLYNDLNFGKYTTIEICNKYNITPPAVRWHKQVLRNEKKRLAEIEKYEQQQNFRIT
jgi:transposase-like protein